MNAQTSCAGLRAKTGTAKLQERFLAEAQHLQSTVDLDDLHAEIRLHCDALLYADLALRRHRGE